MENEVARLSSLLENKLSAKSPARKPRLHLITAAHLPPKPAELFDDLERERIRDRVRMWTRIYGLEQWLRQELASYATLEEMPDAVLLRQLERIEHGVQCIRDGVGFDEAGLM